METHPTLLHTLGSERIADARRSAEHARTVAEARASATLPCRVLLGGSLANTGRLLTRTGQRLAGQRSGTFTMHADRAPEGRHSGAAAFRHRQAH